jgi:putative acyl-CoA dehydrogenase
VTNHIQQNVDNDVPPLVDYNLYASDASLGSAIVVNGVEWADEMLFDFGRKLGSAEVIDWGKLANENPPVLNENEVEFHPSWHSLMRMSIENGLHNLPWTETRSGGHTVRAAMAMMMSQIEAGHLCPISMTYSANPVIHRDPELAKQWEPKLRSRAYGTAALIGMAMTEKQGGSDVRTNTTRAERTSDGDYLLYGAKWFCSAPMSDAFLVLAQTPAGLTCFLMPRRQTEFHVVRLKPKLGNRSNASSEVEFHGARAKRIGEEGMGVPTIIQMVHHTRLDCVMASAALMRQSFVQAIHHAKYRRAFGKLLFHQPLMRNVLADLAVESNAATLLLMRLARAFDEKDDAFARIGVAIGKYWTAKRTPAFVAEALECLGGNGYIEDSIMPRLYREAPLASIWEGSGNVIALDVLRSIVRRPEALDRVLDEIGLANDPRVERFVDDVHAYVREEDARTLAERLALALQASLMIRFRPRAMADAFCASRLGGSSGRTFGTLPRNVDIDSVIAVCDQVGHS